MGISLPAPLGAFTGLCGEDILDVTERQVRPYYGRGLYGGEGSDHQKYRRGQIMGLAWVAAGGLAIRVNAIPDRAIEMLDEWETTLGLPHAPDSWTVEQRQARVRARCLEARGANEADIEAAIDELLGGAYTTITNNPPGYDPLTYLVQVSTFSPSSAEYADIVALLWRLTPAHVSCWIEFTTPAIGPYRLGDTPP